MKNLHRHATALVVPGDLEASAESMFAFNLTDTMRLIGVCRFWLPGWGEYLRKCNTSVSAVIKRTGYKPVKNVTYVTGTRPPPTCARAIPYDDYDTRRPPGC